MPSDFTEWGLAAVGMRTHMSTAYTRCDQCTRCRCCRRLRRCRGCSRCGRRSRRAGDARAAGDDAAVGARAAGSARAVVGARAVGAAGDAAEAADAAGGCDAAGAAGGACAAGAARAAEAAGATGAAPLEDTLASPLYLSHLHLEAQVASGFMNHYLSERAWEKRNPARCVLPLYPLVRKMSIATAHSHGLSNCHAARAARPPNQR